MDIEVDRITLITSETRFIGSHVDDISYIIFPIETMHIFTTDPQIKVSATLPVHIGEISISL